MLVLNFHFKGGKQEVVSSSPVFSGLLHAFTPLDVAGHF